MRETENLPYVFYTKAPYLWPYSKRKLEFESNSSEILQVNCKFIRDSTLT